MVQTLFEYFQNLKYVAEVDQTVDMTQIEYTSENNFKAVPYNSYRVGPQNIESPRDLNYGLTVTNGDWRKVSAKTHPRRGLFTLNGEIH
jgi:hypothetical protein